jgi:hypothetical protein
MMNKIMKLLLACVFTLVGVSFNILSYAAEENSCPPRLSVQHKIDQDVSDWQKKDINKNHPFVNVVFYKESTEKKNILPPSNEKEVKGASIKEWELPTLAGGYWVSCVYEGTGATVAKKLSDDVAYCKAEYDKDFTWPVVKRWGCSSSEVKLKQETKSKKRKIRYKRKTD